MRMPTLAALTFAATALLGTTAAFADPSLGSGLQIGTTESSWESLVTAPGQELRGIVKVTAVDNAQGTPYAYLPGTPPYLAGVFKGFTLQSASAISGGGFKLAFSGGSLNYYNFNAGADPFAGNNLINGNTTQATAIAAIEAGNNFLKFSPQTIFTYNVDGSCTSAGNALNDGNITLVINISAGTLSNVLSSGTEQVYLDLIGGSAFAALVQDGFVNGNTGQLADATYQGSANQLQCGQFSVEWQVCGSNNLTANVIPEPITLSLFGAGLVGAAALRRRKVKKA